MKTIVSLASFEETFARKRVRAEKLSRGEYIRPERRITFERAEDIFACLTLERIRLIQAVREHPVTVPDLAKALGRSLESVELDVAELSSYGLLGVIEGSDLIAAEGGLIEIRATV